MLGLFPHGHRQSRSVPMVGRPVTLEQLLNVTQPIPPESITITNKPLLFTGYTRTPKFCFLNGAGRDMYNERFCRDSIVNFTLVDLPYALNGTLEIIGLVTYNISYPNERIGNMSTYNISNCAQGNISESREWLASTHMNSYG